MTETSNASSGIPAAPEHSVAMWGAPGSGKTTFLGALNIALARHGGEWRMVGKDPASTEMLTKLTTALATDRRFPQGTQGIAHCRWVLRGSAEQATRKWLQVKREKVPVRIGLDLVDAQGRIYSDQADLGVMRDDLIKNLQASRGIVFLYDPIREFKAGDAFEHTVVVLNELAHRMGDSPDLVRGYLPHYVAVCVTKFDEVKVLQTAEKLDLLTTDAADEFGFPRVDDADAEDLLSELCSVSSSGNADLMLNTLRQHFLPERIRFFVTSAIGFHVDQLARAYNPEDFQNQVIDPGGVRIRGTVHPINVVEPILWLARQVAGKPSLPVRPPKTARTATPRRLRKRDGQ